ncbi:unnamed protein product [Rhizoctonia solani]|uniref:Uncharacterized protein n=1 Tax=Rhizoctonia solani TaxID=456999 RepID=A0A8H7H8U0_9AGAM|nr:uncharacterized protein RhiXN_04300 [Rhizoctonia solani]KAF8680886.1 hypothetical protein RHS04_03157 [Rhizoctonia solani]QRW16299.1 hypothetical protein RhiXN_04300 [Rhizoctonia solani]CAE6427838.1 unnamed protein product [Rhizoctonia solani]
MAKKFVENKNEELLLATQAIDYTEDARMKRPSQRPNEQPKTSRTKKKVSNKSRKLDLAKLAVKQQEKKRRLARKTSHQGENGLSNAEDSRPRDNRTNISSSRSKATLSDTQSAPKRQVKRVAFA